MIYLVTGANGHLGNCTVRELIKKGKNVRASVRDIKNTIPFKGLKCEIIYADILDKKSLLNAFKDVDVLYHVAAVFKHWAKNPQKEIYEANLKGTQNVMEAAKERGIKKIIYVSSIAALDSSLAIMDENSWGKKFPNVYFHSKNDAEILAWELADKLQLDMITVLPSGMIGPEIFSHFPPAMNLLNNIIKNKLRFDPQYGINYVHVQDVAQGMILAEEKGRIGQRYILGSEKPVNTTQVLQIAKSLYPEVKLPKKKSKRFQLFLATLMQVGSKITGKPPLLLRGNIHHYYKMNECLNIDKARSELGYNPRESHKALVETFEYLKNRSLD